MDKINTFLIIICVFGIITLGIGTAYIPSIGGIHAEGESQQDFNNRQQDAIYNSSGFKATMVGTGITIASALTIWIRSCIDDYREVIITNKLQPKQLRSILKVKSATIVPQETIDVIVEDTQVKSQADLRPPIRTTSNLIPIQHNPPTTEINFMELQPIGFKGPVIEKIRLHGNFKYPPPYHNVRHG